MVIYGIYIFTVLANLNCWGRYRRWPSNPYCLVVEMLDRTHTHTSTYARTHTLAHINTHNTHFNTLQIIYFGREHCPAVNHAPTECPICSFAAVPPYDT
jgi:hypothetical protein